MKLLINICAHDGIISYYTGVGTMVKRYIKFLNNHLINSDIEYKINLITPEYKEDSFGFSKFTKQEHEKIMNVNIIQVSNGSGGTINFGLPKHWNKLAENTANIIKKMNLANYDKVVTIYNDTPFVNMLDFLHEVENHITVWIPHSSIKVHEVDSAVEDSKSFYEERLYMEMKAIRNINMMKNAYLGGIGEFFSKHLIDEYNLNPSKILKIYNGEFLKEKKKMKNENEFENKKLFEKIKFFKRIILSFGRAEEYKNLTATMFLGRELKIPTVVIAQSYYKEQPILNEYRNIANETNTFLFIDAPFNFSKYILNNFNGEILLVCPSKKETFGLIINEVRKLNKNNIMIIANDVNGFSEQIEDLKDGVLVDLNDINGSAKKINDNIDKEKLKEMNFNSQITLKERYDFDAIMTDFLNNILGEINE